MMPHNATEALDAESLEHETLRDRSTGLANGALFGEHVLLALASAKRSDEPRAVLVMDLGRFRELVGKPGEALVRHVGERLVAALRQSDTVARLDGEQFAILPGGATDLAAAAGVAAKIQRTFQSGFIVDDEVVHITPTIGIALFPEHGRASTELLRCADAAVSAARQSGASHAVFVAASQQQAAHDLALLVDLRHCVARDQLVLHYQPKIDLGTREIFGVEALLRWRHPVRGLLSPARFMPAVERTELIEPVTRWVIDEALRQQRLWRDEGVDLSMAVNISAHSLRPSSNLPDTVAELTASWSTAPHRLTLELTERALRAQTAAPDILSRLHGMGEMMSIDDFGTGYTSLADLHRLPVDEIKIDRSFVTSLHATGEHAVIVRTIVDLAHNLGFAVVAEGVEDEEARDLLQAYGCDSVQGYLFSRPCAAEQLTTWLTESPYGYGPPATLG
jgi:diguanylate cyclase (GGDEF)-like protein